MYPESYAYREPREGNHCTRCGNGYCSDPCQRYAWAYLLEEQVLTDVLSGDEEPTV